MGVAVLVALVGFVLVMAGFIAYGAAVGIVRFVKLLIRAYNFLTAS